MKHMLHIGDILLARKNTPEPSAHKPLVSSMDFSSDAGFFSMLKNQIEPVEQAAVTTTESSERGRQTPINDDRSAKEREKSGRLENDPAKSEIRRAEQPQKPDPTGMTGETKAPRQSEMPVEKNKVPSEKQEIQATGEKKPLPRNNPDLKTGRPDLAQVNDLMEGLRRMINAATRSDGEPALKGLKEAFKEFHGAIRSGKQGPDRAGMNAALEKIAALLQKTDPAAMPRLLLPHLAKTVAGMREMLTRHTQGDEKSMKQAIVPEPGAATTKELLDRLTAALEGMKQEGSESRQGRQGAGGGSYETVASLKSEPGMRQFEGPAAGAPRNNLFRETLEQIIQKARVTVRDGQNGSFSVRLNPRELGSVSIHLGLQDGVVHGRFLVTTQEAKDLLLVNIEQIKQQLDEAGISIGEFQVNVNDQRGRMLHDRDRDDMPPIIPGEHAAVIEDEYRANTILRHEGHINVII